MTGRSWLGGSFRDPGGRLFRQEGVLYREVFPTYKAQYQKLMKSGLYDALVSRDLLVPHEEVAHEEASDSNSIVLRPEPIRFVSYPYEWPFSALKAAALLTLKVQQVALKHGMTLKDASVFNVQFRHTHPVFIDTLSFDDYEGGTPWHAYYQFCKHFLAPLAVGAYADWTIRGLWRAELDGLPLTFASRCLPLHSWLKPSLLMHLHLHALGERKFSVKSDAKAHLSARMTAHRLEALCRSLRRATETLEPASSYSTWKGYYESCGHYPEHALNRKDALVADLLKRIAPRTVWDLGSNTGRYSLLAAEHADIVVAFDSDAEAIEQQWSEASERGRKVLPLLTDLTNPSPSLGWRNREHMSLAERGPADVALLLATIHHLRLGGNIPLNSLAQWLAELARRTVVEWVPRDDPHVEQLVSQRGVAATDYNERAYRGAFAGPFELISSEPLPSTGRRIDLWQRRDTT